MSEVKEGRVAELTADDRKELTAFNLLAHSLLRENADENGIPPCWLAMSDEAKAEARDAARLYVDEHVGMGFGAMTLEMAERKINGTADRRLVAKFVEAEAHFKRGRAEGDPHAYFAD
jgi:hypothetical protein